MKILAINGSARKGGNTFKALSLVLKELDSIENNIEIIELSDKHIAPCRACFACSKSKDKNCVFKNDDFFDIFEKMKAADVIILGSPTYSANVSASMQALLERSAVVADTYPELLAHKIGASLSINRRAGALNAVDTMNHFFLNHNMFIVGSSYWNVLNGALPGDIENDEEGKATMTNLGKNIGVLLAKF